MFGNLPPHPVITQALVKAAESDKFNGYGHSKGVILDQAMHLYLNRLKNILK